MNLKTDLPPALMLQGTSSNAGKSLLTTALCRLFTREGYRVAPFKAQNMSLNSFVTADGREIGRAQALQAQACGLDADARMNPILLKPVSEQGSQLLILGQPAGVLHSADYLRSKPKLWAVVNQSYRELSAGKDLMLLEGAGSPAEINLRRHDLVNMRMALFAHARVLLVADIDRGGAFAALAGTMQLLKPGERNRIAGFILNKFRGDVSLLTPAMEQITQLTGRPFLGVVPWLNNLGLPDEDSVSFKTQTRSVQPNDAAQKLDFVLIDLPRISNFTDLDALNAEDGVNLRIVRDVEDLGKPDCVILPGTRNVGADLHFLHQTGLATALQNYAKEGGKIIGLCGGLQMLGQRISDPLSLEGGQSVSGLGLLALQTELHSEKILRRTQCTSSPLLTGQKETLLGYEIHHGRSISLDSATMPVMFDTQGQAIGFGLRCQDTCQIWGTYLHGLFDNDTFRHAWINKLRQAKNLPVIHGKQWTLEPALDRLADVVAQAIPMQTLKALVFSSN